MMTYDMHSASQGDSKTGENAPLFSNDSLNVVRFTRFLCKFPLVSILSVAGNNKIIADQLT